jgi:16S rRNA (adenine1518-N6/adenine1519-N6)-dimethyltransferase
MLIKPKKSLGQNYLIDNNILNLMADIGEIKNDDIVLEVGPGTGNLTEKLLLKKPKKIILIEKDKNLSNNLKSKFNEKINLLNEDILKVNEEILSNKKMIFYGNLPYNISSQILAKWIKLKNLNYICKKFILMFQKEVAERIIAKTNQKEYGRLSILSSWRLNIKKIRDINPNSFYPVPKVKSTILMIEPKLQFYKIKNPKNLEHITNIFFNQKRKMINKPLKILFNDVDYIAKKFQIDLNQRPQNLPPLIYYKLCEEYETLN